MKRSEFVPLLLFILLLFTAFTLHKFYVSMCQIRFAENEEALQITLKIFTDDLEKALSEYSGKQVKIVSDKFSPETDSLIASYLHENITIRTDSLFRSFIFLGKDVDYDVVWCFLEIDSVGGFHDISVTNIILTEIYRDQVNLVNITKGNRKKGLLLTRENPAGNIRFSP